MAAGLPTRTETVAADLDCGDAVYRRVVSNVDRDVDGQALPWCDYCGTPLATSRCGCRNLLER